MCPPQNQNQMTPIPKNSLLKQQLEYELAKEAKAEALEQAIYEDFGIEVDGDDLMRDMEGVGRVMGRLFAKGLKSHRAITGRRIVLLSFFLQVPLYYTNPFS